MEDLKTKIRIYGIREINYYLKELVWEDTLLRSLWLKGEISGYKEHSSGHIYFSLKEGNSALRCVMFRRYAGNLEFQPQNGMEVMAYGGISFYERDGSCQLYVEEMFPAGAGAHFLALEQLKKKLEAEGLFSPEIKKPIPRFAKVIGVVTAPEGAAWQDIQRVAKSRFPGVELRLFPSLVQGQKAPEALIAAIEKADAAGCQVLIVGRGGGSYEDLASFDDEGVVRAIFRAKTPVISGVGHESDFSLADLAADIRATTPSHAAQLAVAEEREMRRILEHYQEALKNRFSLILQNKANNLRLLAKRPVFANPQILLEGRERQLEQFKAQLKQITNEGLNRHEKSLAIIAARLELLSPIATMARGYAICGDKDNNIIKSIAEIKTGDEIWLQILDGKARCLVEEKIPGEIISEK